jgi:hypothetical protein
MLGRIAAVAALSVICALLSGCSKSVPAGAAVGPSPDPEPPSTLDDGSGLSALRLYSASQASAFRGHISALEGIGRILEASARRPAKPEPGLRGFGAGMAGPAIPARDGGQLAKGLTLLKSGATGTAAQGGEASEWAGMAALSDDEMTQWWFEGDTAWFVRGDSAKGAIHWIHVFHDAEGEAFSLVRDSLVYKWPYDDKAPVLIASHTTVKHWDGGEDRLGLTDDDGDGTLMGTPDGMTVRIRKERTVARGDTAFKSVWHMDHGDSSEYHGHGEGRPIRFADTTLVGGRAVAWTVTSDGDGDGLALRAAGRGNVLIRNEACAVEASGSRTCVASVQGAGPDADPMTPLDNPVQRYSVAVFSPAGDTLSVTEYGDGDGDGVCSSSAPGSANRIWETRRFPARDGLKAYRDSSVRQLHDPEDESDDRLAFHMAETFTADGGVATITSGTGDGRGTFGTGDTVRVRERIAYPDPAPQGSGDTAAALDSVIRTASLLPGNLADPGDDRILAWSSVFHYRTRPGGIRKWRREESDPAKRSLAWEERLFFPDGDSLSMSGTEAGPGTGSYILATAHHAVRSGSYESAGGRIRDTIRYLDHKAQGPAFDIGEGTFRAGFGDLTLKRVYGDGKGEATRLIVIPGSDGGSEVMALSGSDTCLYLVRGDSAFWTMEKGDTTFAFASAARGDGGYRVTQTLMNGAGDLVAEGSYLFGRDGSGSGVLHQRSGYGAGKAAGISIAADGAVVIGAESAEGLAAKP